MPLKGWRGGWIKGLLAARLSGSPQLCREWVYGDSLDNIFLTPLACIFLPLTPCPSGSIRTPTPCPVSCAQPAPCHFRTP